jgi:hypothetical protein
MQSDAEPFQKQPPASSGPGGRLSHRSANGKESNKGFCGQPFAKVALELCLQQFFHQAAVKSLSFTMGHLPKESDALEYQLKDWFRDVPNAYSAVGKRRH